MKHNRKKAKVFALAVTMLTTLGMNTLGVSASTVSDTALTSATLEENENATEGIVKDTDYKAIGNVISQKIKMRKGTVISKEELGFLYETFDAEYSIMRSCTRM